MKESSAYKKGGIALIAKIEQAELFGKATFPPSKSDTHRLLITAALAEGESIIHGISRCDDTMATVGALCAMGARITLADDTARVVGMDITKAKPSGELLVNESGSTLRFLIPLVMLGGGEAIFRGKKRLFERPLSIYGEIAERFGIKFCLGEDSLTVCGKIQGGEYRIPGDISSQFITGLLFALPRLAQDSTIMVEPPFESRPYVDMTVSTLEKFGVTVEFADEYTIHIPGGQAFSPRELHCEGDWSGGAFLLALKMLHDKIEISGYNKDSLQGDRICEEYLDLLAGGYPTLDISDCPDLGPVLFAMAAYFGGAEFVGTKRLAIKESDRCTAMKTELEKMGADVQISENRVKIRGGNLKKSEVRLCGHNDHRIVMSLAVLCTSLGGEIEGAEAIKKSYPQFFETLRSLGGRMELFD